MSKINYQFFPRSRGITSEIKEVIDCFFEVEDKINSENHNLKSCKFK